MERKFTKMHGCGNDYIYFDCTEQELDHPDQVSIRLSDRHFGVGGDGIVMICASDVADAKMRMFNADGSEGKMCGNAIRCVGKYLSENGLLTPSNKNKILIETLSGVKDLTLYIQENKVESVRVNMGEAELTPSKIPVNLSQDRIVDHPITVGDEQYRMTCVSMGNPHCVLFCNDVDCVDLDKIGPLFEKHALFPEQINTEFVQVYDKNTLNMRVWERGSGETWACGTGACAAAVAAVENGYCNQNEEIIVQLRGGDLVIQYTDDAVYMTGTAQKVFDGTIDIMEVI